MSNVCGLIGRRKIIKALARWLIFLNSRRETDQRYSCCRLHALQPKVLPWPGLSSRPIHTGLARANASKWNLLLWMGVFTLHASNIKGFAFEFACVCPVWVGPQAAPLIVTLKFHQHQCRHRTPPPHKTSGQSWGFITTDFRILAQNSGCAPVSRFSLHLEMFLTRKCDFVELYFPKRIKRKRDARCLVSCLT